MGLLLSLKKMFRPVYYWANEGKVVSMNGFNHLQNSKWIVKEDYGMAYFKGYYEPEICDFLLKNLSSSSCFVDVGAHAGYFSLFSAQIAKEGYVYSFEPEFHNFEFVNRIKSINNIENWTVINKAVGAEVGKLYFSIGNTTSTGKISTTGEIEVQVTTIDAELANITRLDLIKIDVEGFGGRVIEGALATIQKFLPKLMIEIHSGSDELTAVLKCLGDLYNFEDLDTKAVVENDNQSVHFIIGTPKLKH